MPDLNLRFLVDGRSTRGWWKIAESNYRGYNQIRVALKTFIKLII